MLEGYTHILFNCFRSDLATTAEAARAVLSSPPPMQFTETRETLNLGEIYSREPPRGGRHAKKVLFFSPLNCPASTVMFANLSDGWHTLANCMSKLIESRFYCFQLSFDGCEWPRNLFEVWDSGRITRHVSTIKDNDRWKFYQQGPIFPEEEEEQYAKRRVAQRLSTNYLITVAGRLGFRIDEDQFWKSSSHAAYFRCGDPSENAMLAESEMDPDLRPLGS
jgi:hypothetical protein